MDEKHTTRPTIDTPDKTRDDNNPFGALTTPGSESEASILSKHEFLPTKPNTNNSNHDNDSITDSSMDNSFKESDLDTT